MNRWPVSYHFLHDFGCVPSRLAKIWGRLITKWVCICAYTPPPTEIRSVFFEYLFHQKISKIGVCRMIQ